MLKNNKICVNRSFLIPFFEMGVEKRNDTGWYVNHFAPTQGERLWEMAKNLRKFASPPVRIFLRKGWFERSFGKRRFKFQTLHERRRRRSGENAGFRKKGFPLTSPPHKRTRNFFVIAVTLTLIILQMDGGGFGQHKGKLQYIRRWICISLSTCVIQVHNGQENTSFHTMWK